jgi:hypothetical protein
MRLAEITLTVERVLAADPQDKRRTAVALAAAEVAPDGIDLIVDHGDSVGYRLGDWWVSVRLPEEIRDRIAGFYAGRASVRPVTFSLLVPEDTDMPATEAEEAAA